MSKIYQYDGNKTDIAIYFLTTLTNNTWNNYVLNILKGSATKRGIYNE